MTALTNSLSTEAQLKARPALVGLFDQASEQAIAELERLLALP